MPLKKLSRKEIILKSKPWISSGLSKSTNIKNKLYRKFMRTNNQCLYAKYKPYRNKLNHLIHITKKINHDAYFTYINPNMKKIWKGIMEIVASKLSASICPSKIVTSSNKVLTNASDIANEFNNYFANVGKTLSQAILTVAINFQLSYLSRLPIVFIVLVFLFHYLRFYLRFPDSVKIARVIPVYKTGSKLLLTNYRPISLLSVFKQIRERLMYK